MSQTNKSNSFSLICFRCKHEHILKKPCTACGQGKYIVGRKLTIVCNKCWTGWSKWTCDNCWQDFELVGNNFRNNDAISEFYMGVLKYVLLATTAFFLLWGAIMIDN